MAVQCANQDFGQYGVLDAIVAGIPGE